MIYILNEKILFERDKIIINDKKILKIINISLYLELEYDIIHLIKLVVLGKKYTWCLIIISK